MYSLVLRLQIWSAALLLILLPVAASAQRASLLEGRGPFDRADTLRGKLSPRRACYDVTFYDLNLRINLADSSIQGSNTIHFQTVSDFEELQIDLFENLKIDSIIYAGRQLKWERMDNAVFVRFGETLPRGKRASFAVHYGGKPRKARRPPWDGGFIWRKDKTGKPWVGVACEGLGASVWWPLKDHLSDEPDSMRITTTVPNGLMCVSNGVMRNAGPSKRNPKEEMTYEWFVSYPINSYNVTINIADYAHFSDQYQGLEGPLALDYYVLSYNVDKARKHFAQVKPMLACFEKMFGPYPFFRDGYALVETPYWGMEHQGAIAYGNNYVNNGWGWDYIIIHESGHEWFGNNISCRDHAELWIHESFTTYSEFVYMECQKGYETAVDYLLSQRGNILNADPILGPPDVNFENWAGSDMYYKGSWMLHTLRNIVKDDKKWWAMIRGMYDEFRLKNVSTEEVIGYINTRLGGDYTAFFQEYLYYSMPPVLEYKLKKKKGKYVLTYRLRANQANFSMPIDLAAGGDGFTRVTATTSFQELALPDLQDPEAFDLDQRSFYVAKRNLDEKK